MDCSVEFMIIGSAGDAKSHAEEAVECAKNGDFDGAEMHMEKANEGLTQAHKAQTDLIFKASNGEEIDINIFLIHAQDHLTMATMAIANARQFIDLYKIVLNKQ